MTTSPKDYFSLSEITGLQSAFHGPLCKESVNSQHVIGDRITRLCNTLAWFLNAHKANLLGEFSGRVYFLAHTGKCRNSQGRTTGRALREYAMGKLALMIEDNLAPKGDSTRFDADSFIEAVNGGQWLPEWREFVARVDAQ